MKLKVKILGLEAGGKPIAVISREDANELGIRAGSRIKIYFGNKESIGIVNISSKMEKGKIGIYEEIREVLSLKENQEVEVELAPLPKSLNHIQNKLKGKKLLYNEIFEIVKDVVKGNLSEIEIASFLTSLHLQGLDLEEAYNLSLAMVNTGKKLSLNKKIVVDKHSIGGVPGDKTSLLLVPLIASLKLTIPKTSSRAITSPAGTADKAEALMPVELEVEEVERVVKRTNGCIVWGGALNLAPADDIFIQIEYPLAIDPLMLPSIMSKKKAVGATHLIIDIPTGRGAKIKTIGDANFLARDFIELGKRLGIKTQCIFTFGEQPIGKAIGPLLEAREALGLLSRKFLIEDLWDKVKHIAFSLAEMVNKKIEERILWKLLKSGKAEKKMREIIEEQGGNKKIKIEDLEPGSYKFEIKSERNGRISWIDNNAIVELSRSLGCPKDKGAGIILHKKIGESVKKGERIATFYAERSTKLYRTEKIMEEINFVGIGKRIEMLIGKTEKVSVGKKAFILER